MQIPSLYRTLPTQGTDGARAAASKMLHGKHLQGEMKDSAVEQLATLPEAWLGKLADENLAYVALSDGETLADTDILWSYTVDSLREDALKAKPIIEQVTAQVNEAIDKEKSEVTDEFQSAMIEHHRPTQLAETLMKEFQAHNLAFAVKVTKDLLPVSYLEGEMGVTRADYDEFLQPEESDSQLFRELLTELNGQAIFQDGSENETLSPLNQTVVVPFKKKGARMVSPLSEASYAQITGQEANLHDGAHYWENRLIVLDDNAVQLPATNSGYHSVLLHESGHAIDYIAETLPDLHHREVIDGLFQKDMEAAAKGVDRFTSKRAKDNAREYMAEAVEAYLTQEVGGHRDYNKPDNNHDNLKSKNPELFEYVDKLMRLSPDELKTRPK